jgi:purine-binding chemotaxis protein CheW
MLQSQILTFEIEGKTFGLLASAVVEIVRAVKATSIDAPGIDAIFNFRGHMMPLIDLRRRLAMPPRAVSASDHFIIVHVDQTSRQAALKVDHARTLIEVSVEELQLAHSKNNFAGVARLDSDIIVIYEVQKLIDDIDFNIDYASI